MEKIRWRRGDGRRRDEEVKMKRWKRSDVGC